MSIFDSIPTYPLTADKLLTFLLHIRDEPSAVTDVVPGMTDSLSRASLSELDTFIRNTTSVLQLSKLLDHPTMKMAAFAFLATFLPALISRCEELRREELLSAQYSDPDSIPGE